MTQEVMSPPAFPCLIDSIQSLYYELMVGGRKQAIEVSDRLKMSKLRSTPTNLQPKIMLRVNDYGWKCG